MEGLHIDAIARGVLSHLNTLRPGHNGRHFSGDIFKWIFLNENVWISINISLKFVLKCPINHIPVLVQKMSGIGEWLSQFLSKDSVSSAKPRRQAIVRTNDSLLTHLCVTRPHWVNHGSCPVAKCPQKYFAAPLWPVSRLRLYLTRHYRDQTYGRMWPCTIPCLYYVTVIFSAMCIWTGNIRVSINWTRIKKYIFILILLSVIF